MGMGRSGKRTLAVLVVAGLGLVLTACGGDDDDAAAPAATDGGGNANTDNDNADKQENADNNDNGGGGDIPEECKDLLGDYLEKLEPFVKDVDWESATLDQMSQIQDQMGSDLSSLDSEITDKCGDYDFTTNPDQMQEAIDIAHDRAPGTVAWLEFIQRLSASVSSISDSEHHGSRGHRRRRHRRRRCRRRPAGLSGRDRLPQGPDGSVRLDEGHAHERGQQGQHRNDGDHDLLLGQRDERLLDRSQDQRLGVGHLT